MDNVDIMRIFPKLIELTFPEDQKKNLIMIVNQIKTILDSQQKTA
jgi:hypothetical protein